MSLRDRIKKFEQLGKDKTENKVETAASTVNLAVNQQGGHRKKFLYPGKQSKASTEHTVVLSQVKAKQSIISDYEADLQQVWSVRKNIHHTATTGTSTNNHGLTGASQQTPGLNRFLQSYSRHGAIPAQPVADPLKEGHFHGRSLRKRSPLQEQNQLESRTWNLKTPGFSYTEGVKRQSPTEGDSPPQTKRKITIREGSPKPTMDIPPIRSFFLQSQEQNDKKSHYAQRMIQGHLKSVGMGQHTPEAGYTRHQQDNNKTVWKKFDQDEFSIN